MRKSEKRPSEICQISENLGELGILDFARMSLITFYRMLHSARVTYFTVFELLRENQQKGLKLPPPRLGSIHQNV